MISITHKESSNTQEFLALFAEATGSEIVYAGTTIVRVNITNKLYLDASGTNLVVTHTDITSGTAPSYTSSVFAKYDIIETDKGVLFCSNVTNMTNRVLGVSSTAGNSKGVFGCAAADYELTDTSAAYITGPANRTNSSWVNTQLIPIYDITSTDYFDDGAYWVYLSKPTDAAQMTLNNKYYYIRNEIALEYTP